MSRGTCLKCLSALEKSSVSLEKRDLLQDKLKKTRKNHSQFQNRLMHIKKILIKKGQKQDVFQTNKIQYKNILQNKTEQIKKNTNLLQNVLTQVKKRKR